MKYITSFSGGKDSEAVEIWAAINLPEHETIFCDTGWESTKTYQHINQHQKITGKQITILKSTEFSDFFDLCIKKKRVASTKSRFCTQKLKTEPMIDYILSHTEDITVLQGVRNDESDQRRNLSAKDEFFKFYFQPYKIDKRGKELFHTYRKKDVFAWCEKYSCDVHRPIIKWSANDVFDFIKANGRTPNPLYFEGFTRVGCFPCINARHSEIRLIAQNYPERIDRIRELEQALGTSFFPANYIPDRFCDRPYVNKKNQRVFFASIDAIVSYVTDNTDQQKLFCTPKGCQSIYNICE